MLNKFNQVYHMFPDVPVKQRKICCPWMPVVFMFIQICVCQKKNDVDRCWVSHGLSIIQAAIHRLVTLSTVGRSRGVM